MSFGLLRWGLESYGYKGYIEQLSILQKRALKIVLMVNRRFPTEELYCQLRINSVTERLNMRTILFMHKIVYGVVSLYIKRRFTFQTPHYRTRNSDHNLNIPRAKTNYGKRRLEYRGAFAWNNLTADLKGTNSNYHFRKQLRSYLK